MSIARFHFGPVTNTSTTEKQVTASLVPPHGVEGLGKRLSSYSPVHLIMLHSCMHIQPQDFPGLVTTHYYHLPFETSECQSLWSSFDYPLYAWRPWYVYRRMLKVVVLQSLNTNDHSFRTTFKPTSVHCEERRTIRTDKHKLAWVPWRPWARDNVYTSTEGRGKGVYCSRMRQVPMVTCVDSYSSTPYTYIQVNYVMV